MITDQIPVMKVLLFAILCLLPYTEARHLLVETEDSDVNLEAASDETISGVGEEAMEEAAEEGMEEAVEEAMEEAGKEGERKEDFFRCLINCYSG